MKSTNGVLLSIVTLLAIMGIVLPAKAEKDVYLHQIRAVNGLAFEFGDSSSFLVATHFGLYAIAPDGLAKQVSETSDVLLELVRHPHNPSFLYSSGHRSKTEKLGVVKSKDGGKTWKKISDGGDQRVAFHSMAISASTPDVLYGVDHALHVSRDGGRTWIKVGEVPGRVFDIAVSQLQPDRIFLATQRGLFESRDGGSNWTKAHPHKRAATMVHVATDGSVLAFLYGLGLVWAPERDTLEWKTIAQGFSNRALMDMAIDPRDPSRFLGTADTGAVLFSQDAGQTWNSFEGSQYATPERIAAGRKVYEDNCLACHGEKGIGENPKNPNAIDDKGLPVAPALDDSAHGWHHSDEQLIKTILEGSPRNERMLAWKDHDVSRADAENVVAYIKSLWNFRSLACQGPRHMSCMR